MTDAERKLWRYLRELTLASSHFRRQATIGPYFADFACHERRVVVEVDGGQHGQLGQSVHDRQRTAYLNANGYRVLRFWNNDVLTNIDGVMGAIADALEAVPKAPTPAPSPPLASLAGGGEMCARKVP